MSKINSVLKNFANHVTSGLSEFVCILCAACERASLPSASISLIPEVTIPYPLNGDVDLREAVEKLRQKFIEILPKESQMPLEEIAFLQVHMDFGFDELAAREKRREADQQNIPYALDPVYACEVSARLRSGREYKQTSKSPPRSLAPGIDSSVRKKGELDRGATGR